MIDSLMRRAPKTDWSGQIAKIIFGVKSKILVSSDSDLESLIQQAKENKALARILPLVEVRSPSSRGRLEEAVGETSGRLKDALRLLSSAQKVCLEKGIPYAVIKSLDALPDIGHDIDLLVGKNLKKVRHDLLKRFSCRTVTLTFCDRHAGKFSTFIDGFDSDFELYTSISQLGEEYYSEEEVLGRRVWNAGVDGGTYLCSKEDRLLITCIHTMYRHGKIRLSDLGIAFEALNSGVDVKYVLGVVDAAGIQRGFAIFMSVLDRVCQNATGHHILPDSVREYVDSTLRNDRVLKAFATRRKLAFPLKLSVGLLIPLFLYKAIVDMSRFRVRSSLHSLVAPALLVMDKAIPLRLQKAISVKIW